MSKCQYEESCVAPGDVLFGDPPVPTCTSHVRVAEGVYKLRAKEKKALNEWTAAQAAKEAESQ